ncbi:MAG: helix-turn-helix domain-containing protein [Bacteroides sp.]
MLLPRVQRIFKQVGENIKLARLRRRYSMEQVAQRAGITRATLQKVEAGNPTTSLETYTKVLFVLGLEKDLLKIAQDDELGRKLIDKELMK